MQARGVDPDLPGVQELLAALDQQYPQLLVGVSWSFGGEFRSSLGDWPSRRVARLTQRSIVELKGIGGSGGIYASPFGLLERDTSLKNLTLQIRPGFRWHEEGPPITGVDIARCLLAAADPEQQGDHRALADAVEQIRVLNVYQVDVLFKRELASPEALLQLPLRRLDAVGGSANDLPRVWGEYIATPATSAAPLGEQTFRPRLKDGTQRPEIIERTFSDPSVARHALRRGEIHAIDRVAPWEVQLLSRYEEIAVQPYGLRLTHVLVPRVGRHPLMADPMFRRALLFGLDRNSILHDELLTGRDDPSASVLSGPFPSTVATADPLGYAADPSLEPRPFQPRLGFSLVRGAWVRYRATQQGENESEEMPPLVLTFPPDPIARTACEAIQRYWNGIGVTVELQEWNPSDPAPATDYDLRYVPLAIWEPTVDIIRLLGPGGLAGTESPYVRQAVRRLATASNATELRSHLYEIHRLVHDELTVLPLWQFDEYFAIHRSLTGVGTRPVTLYQNVESWQVGVSSGDGS